MMKFEKYNDVSSGINNLVYLTDELEKRIAAEL